VIVVIVAEQHERDGWQIVETHTRRSSPPGSGERERARPLGVHRVYQDVAASDLNEKRGMADEGDADVVRSGWGWPPRLDGNFPRPGSARREQHPRHHPERLPIRAVRIEESAAIEVIAAGSHLSNSSVLLPGVSPAAMNESAYYQLTCELTIAALRAPAIQPRSRAGSRSIALLSRCASRGSSSQRGHGGLLRAVWVAKLDSPAFPAGSGCRCDGTCVHPYPGWQAMGIAISFLACLGLEGE